MLDPKKAGNIMSQRNTRLFLLDSNFRQIKDWRFVSKGFIDKNIFPTSNGIAFDGQLFTCNFRFPISNAFEEIKENKAFIAFQLAVDTLRPKETVGTIPGFLHDKSYYATNLETAIYQGVLYGGLGLRRIIGTELINKPIGSKLVWAKQISIILPTRAFIIVYFLFQYQTGTK